MSSFFVNFTLYEVSVHLKVKMTFALFELVKFRLEK